MAVAAENRHAVEDETLLCRIGEAVMDGECGAVTGVTRQLLDVFVIRAARLGDEFDLFLQVVFDGLLRSHELFLQFFR